jgi:hypothetical protein
LMVFGTRNSPSTLAYRATVACRARVALGATVARGARQFSTGISCRISGSGLLTIPLSGNQVEAEESMLLQTSLALLWLEKPIFFPC